MACGQLVARALLAAATPRPPALWWMEPGVELRRELYGKARRIGWAIVRYAAAGNPFIDVDRMRTRGAFRPNLLGEMVNAGALDTALLNGPFGKRLFLEDLAKIENNFTGDRVGAMITWSRFRQLQKAVADYSHSHQAEFWRNGRWLFPATILADAVKARHLDPACLKDAWGQPIKLMQRKIPLDNPTGWTQFDHHELVSAGPDRRFDTLDDLKQSNAYQRQRALEPWFGLPVEFGLERALPGGSDPPTTKTRPGSETPK